MALAQAMAGEVVKAITATVTTAGIAGTGRLWQRVRRSSSDFPAQPPADSDELKDLLDRWVRDDPERLEQLALELAETASVSRDNEVGAVFVPPIPFCDRDGLRKQLPEFGVYGFAGPSGCGKTALVRQLAADRDVRVVRRAYVDLDGFRTGDVLRIAEVKRDLLRQWGVTDVVTADPELSQQYVRAPLMCRSLLVIENVLGAGEVAALVESWPAALVLVTTRRLTEDLWGCLPRWIELGGLDRAGARALLASRCPISVVDAEPAEADTLLGRFRRQPHAIHVLAGILSRRARERTPIAGLLAEFESKGISETDGLLAAVLSGLVAQLPESAREIFRLLASFPAGQFTIDTAERFLDRPVRRDIELLREIGLVEPAADDRFRIGWSLRRFAGELGRPAEADVVLDRLLADYAPRAVAADLAGGRRMRYYPIPHTNPWPPGEDRIRWLAAEAEVLAELVEYAYLRGRDDEVGQLCGALEVLSLHVGRHELCLVAYERGVRAARRQNARALLARQHALCGRAATLLHRFDRARSELDAARAVAEGLDEPALKASIEEFLGRLAEEQAGSSPTPDWRPAIEAFGRALAIDRADPDAHRARGLHARMLANVLVKAGIPAEVASLLTEALAYTVDDRNVSRVYTVWAKYDVVHGGILAARGNLDRAREYAAAAGATQYGAELEDLAAEIDYASGEYGAARSRWGALAQTHVSEGHPRAAEFLAKLNRTPPGR